MKWNWNLKLKFEIWNLKFEINSKILKLYKLKNSKILYKNATIMAGTKILSGIK